MMLPELVSAAKSLTEDAFSQRYPKPFLVWKVVKPAPIEPSSSGPITRERTLPRLTAAPPEPILRSEADLLAAYGAAQVAKLQKNFFQAITIGRTSNNDIMISDPTISQFHAWIREDPPSYFICDAKSRFGTTLDGVAVPSEHEKGVLLRVGAQLLMGSTTLLFLNGKTLYRWIHSKIASIQK